MEPSFSTCGRRRDGGHTKGAAPIAIHVSIDRSNSAVPVHTQRRVAWLAYVNSVARSRKSEVLGFKVCAGDVGHECRRAFYIVMVA